MKVGLEALTSYFPEMVVKREDVSYLNPVIPEGMEDVYRAPDERRRLKDERAIEIMAEKVARKVLDSAGLKPGDIDYIIAGNIGGRFVLPLIGTWIHHSLGFPEEVPVLNMQNCCAGFVDGCNVAWNMILGGRYKRILVVMATAWDCGGKGIFDMSAPLSVVGGDGAGAGIISSQNLKCEFVSYHNRTYGQIYDHLASELRTPENPELLAKIYPQIKMGNYLFADEFFYGWQEKIGKDFAVEGINKALKEANLTLKDLDMVVIHQTISALIERWMNRRRRSRHKQG